MIGAIGATGILLLENASNLSRQLEHGLDAGDPAMDSVGLDLQQLPGIQARRWGKKRESVRCGHLRKSLSHPQGVFFRFLAAKLRHRGSASDFDGDDAVVMSYNRDGVGAAWTLTRDARYGTWDQTPFQTDEPIWFGWDIAIRGGTAVVGAPAYGGHKVSHPANEGYSWWGGRGAAVVLARDDAGGGWHTEATLLPEVADADSSFGVSVDVSSELVVF